MHTKDLKEFLIKKHCTIGDDPNKWNKRINGDVTTLSIGSLIWVKSRISWSFTKRWYSRADSELTDHFFKYWQDWVGHAETAPSKITRPKKLNEWALLNTTYELFERDPYDVDDRSYMKCSGRWVEKLSEEGKATLRVASLIKGDGLGWVSLKCKKEIEYIQLLK